MLEKTAQNFHTETQNEINDDTDENNLIDANNNRSQATDATSKCTRN